MDDGQNRGGARSGSRQRVAGKGDYSQARCGLDIQIAVLQIVHRQRTIGPLELGRGRFDPEQPIALSLDHRSGQGLAAANLAEGLFRGVRIQGLRKLKGSKKSHRVTGAMLVIKKLFPGHQAKREPAHQNLAPNQTGSAVSGSS